MGTVFGEFRYSPVKSTGRLRRTLEAGALRGIDISIALGFGVLLVGLALGTVLLLYRSHETAMLAARRTLENASLVAENTINRQLLQVDGALASLPAVLSAAAGAKGQIDQDLASRVLGAFYFENFAFRDLLLIRSDGAVWAAARPRPRNQPVPFSLSRQELAARPGAIVVKGPVLNPYTGNWSWFLVRSVSLPGVGTLLACAEVPTPFLTALLSPLGDIPGLEIRLERPDGVLLANFPHHELEMGRQIAPSFSGWRDGKLVRLAGAATPSGGLAIARQTLYPDVGVLAILDLGPVMRDWRRDRDRLIIASGLAGLLLLAAAAALNAALKQRERVEAERKRSREMLESAIASMDDGFVMWDEQDRLLTCNSRFKDIYAVSAPFIRPGEAFENIIRGGALLGQYPQAGDDIEEFVQATIRWHRSGGPPLERLLPDGRWVLIKERAIPSGGTVGIRTDITGIRRTLADLAIANERVSQAMSDLTRQNQALIERDNALRNQNMLFDAALNNMCQGLLMVDSGGNLIVCNLRFTQLFRIRPEDALPGTDVESVFRAVLLNGGLSPETAAFITERQSRIARSKGPGSFLAKDTPRLALAVSQRPLSEGGWVATYEDVTDQHVAEERIRFMAHHDALTGLPNRVLLQQRMNSALSSVSEPRQEVALLFFDLDRFKNVNDTLGHSAGDALLAAVARRLQTCTRSCDIIARLGGDEFAALILTADLPEAATELANRIIRALSAPYQIGERPVQVGVSIGVAMSDGPAVNSDTLFKNADMALYEAKSHNRGGYCVFEHRMEQLLWSRIAIETDLKAALGTDQFEAFYQPIFYVETRELWGYEALIRWRHPARGLILPGEFIPLAEELGIIEQIGEWMLRQVCSDAAGMPSDIKLAVNLSPRQLENSHLVEAVSQALVESRIGPDRLELEITETALFNNNTATRDVLFALHNMGISIALDDFGTGYSSLSYLRAFPFDKIKIDRLFVSEMATRQDSAAIVSSVVQLARTLGMSTTAEGIETDAQLDLVAQVGCTTAQGYLLGMPAKLDQSCKSQAPYPQDRNGDQSGSRLELALPG